MDAPAFAELTSVQIAELTVLMTPQGYQAAVNAFGQETIQQFVATRPCLLLAAADLLDGLGGGSGGVGETGGQITKFKLDVLEFQFSGASRTVDFGTISKSLRERAKDECADKNGTGGGGANPAPILEGWGLG